MLKVYQFLKWPHNYSDALQAHQILSSYIEVWNQAYYNSASPIISDELYDLVYRHLVNIETVYNISSVIQASVGYKCNNSIMHKYRLYSLNNAFTMDDLLKFEQSISKYLNIEYLPTWVIEPKLDGICINLIYNNGILISALTRGDGFAGKSVTDNIMTMNSIPKYIPYKDYIEIRGEIVVQLSEFNSHMFATPRNEAASSIQQNDISITAQRKILFYPHGVMPLLDHNYVQIKHILKEYGFMENPYTQCTGISNFTLPVFSNLNLPSDGLVFKLLDTRLHIQLGYNNKAPRYAIAYKFKKITSITKVNNIVITVGRTGVITPIALIEPIELSGSIITKVSMHNFDKRIRINDIIEIKKAGEIIPYIEQVFYELRDQDSIEYIQPTQCPSCNALLSYEGKKLLCTNVLCSEQIIKQLAYFTNILEIPLGEALIRQLYDSNIIKTKHDIFKLPDLSGLHKWGKKSFAKLQEKIKYIQHNTTYSTFLTALGIELIGPTHALLIEKYGIEHVSENIRNIYHNNSQIINTMSQYFTFPQQSSLHTVCDSLFYNKRVVITGTFNISRKAMKDRLKIKGAIIMNNVSNNTDIIIIGRNPSTSKIQLIPCKCRIFRLYTFLR